MKKLVDVKLAANGVGALFSLEDSVGGGNSDARGVLDKIERGSYDELIRGEPKGILAYIPWTKYNELREKGEID